MNGRSPMGEESAQAALYFLLANAEKAGKARAEMAYFEDWRKVVLSKLKRAAPPSERSDAAREAWAREQQEYQDALLAKYAAIEQFETLSWKRTHAEATIEAWRSKGAQNRSAEKMR